MGIVGPHESRDGFDDQKEEAVGDWEAEANILLRLGSHDAFFL